MITTGIKFDTNLFMEYLPREPMMAYYYERELIKQPDKTPLQVQKYLFRRTIAPNAERSFYFVKGKLEYKESRMKRLMDSNEELFRIYVKTHTQAPKPHSEQLKLVFYQWVYQNPKFGIQYLATPETVPKRAKKKKRIMFTGFR